MDSVNAEDGWYNHYYDWPKSSLGFFCKMLWKYNGCHSMSLENLQSPQHPVNDLRGHTVWAPCPSLGLPSNPLLGRKCQSLLSIPGKLLFRPQSPDKMLPSYRKPSAFLPARLKHFHGWFLCILQFLKLKYRSWFSSLATHTRRPHKSRDPGCAPGQLKKKLWGPVCKPLV